MSKTRLMELRDMMNLALMEDFPFVAVEIHIEGFPTNEIIINRRDNIPSKLKYYEDAYDDDLIHKYSPSISIVDFDYADFVDELKWFREEG
jgi:hypothetical protein